MLLVAGVDALGRVAGKEILIEFKAADFLYHGQAFFLGHTGIDGGFVHHNVAFAYHLADSLGGAPQWLEVGTVVVVDGGWNGHYVEVAIAYLVEIGGAAEAVVVDGVLQQLVAHLECCVVAGHQCLAAFGVHVEADCLVFCREETCERKAYVSEADNADFNFFFHYIVC